jgi:hypothetical protein
MRVAPSWLLRANPPVLRLQPAGLNRIIQDLTIAVAASRHEDVKDAEQLMLSEATRQQERTCVPIVSMALRRRTGYVCRAEHVIQGLRNPGADEATP